MASPRIFERRVGSRLLGAVQVRASRTKAFAALMIWISRCRYPGHATSPSRSDRRLTASNLSLNARARAHWNDCRWPTYAQLMPDVVGDSRPEPTKSMSYVSMADFGSVTAFHSYPNAIHCGWLALLVESVNLFKSIEFCGRHLSQACRTPCSTFFTV